jgi:hypothetical protein
MNFADYVVWVFSWTIVDYCDAEHADMDNPRGEVYAEVYRVIIESPKGERWEVESYRDSALAERQAVNIQARLDSGRWVIHAQPTDPRYGSEQYLAEESWIVAREQAEDRIAH